MFIALLMGSNDSLRAANFFTVYAHLDNEIPVRQLTQRTPTPPRPLRISPIKPEVIAIQMSEPRCKVQSTEPNHMMWISSSWHPWPSHVFTTSEDRYHPIAWYPVLVWSIRTISLTYVIRGCGCWHNRNADGMIVSLSRLRDK
jgi:hypothetical protein